MDVRVKYKNEMTDLNNEILRMAIVVRELLDRSVRALVEKDIEMSHKIVKEDKAIDEMELALCDRCATLIATEQPVAKDLRIIIGALKIVTDLERMADLACHVAKATIRLDGEPYMTQLEYIPKMAHIAGKMAEDSILAFIHQDPDVAEAVALRDDQIDDIFKKVTKKLLTCMINNPATTEQGSTLMFVSRSIERYADHAENICEWVVYSSTGIHKEL